MRKWISRQRDVGEIKSQREGTPDFFCGFLLLLGALAVLTVAYGLVAVSLGGLLLAITSGASYCFRWLKNHRFTGQAGH